MTYEEIIIFLEKQKEILKKDSLIYQTMNIIIEFLEQAYDDGYEEGYYYGCRDGVEEGYNIATDDEDE